MDLSGTVRGGLEAAKADLGAAEASEGVDARTATQIERAMNESFVAAFRTVMLVSAGLALASALVAALLVGDRRVQPTSRDPRPSDWRRARRGCCVLDGFRKLPARRYKLT